MPWEGVIVVGDTDARTDIYIERARACVCVIEREHALRAYVTTEKDTQGERHRLDCSRARGSMVGLMLRVDAWVPRRGFP